NERPVLLPCRALFDPSRQQRDLPLGERLARRCAALTSWHPDSRIRGSDAPDHFAFGRITWYDREPAAAQRMLCSIFQVEPQRCQLRGRSMTLEAFVREYGTDVSIEFDGR